MPSPPSTVSNSSRASDSGMSITRAEADLKTAIDAHVAHLEQQLAARDRTVHAMKLHMEETIRDFKYNEQLIADRDADIAELTQLTHRLQREKANLTEMLTRERAVNADASHRIEDLTVQLQNLRMLHDESVTQHQVTLDRLRADYEEQLRRVSEKHLLEREVDTKVVTTKLHETEDVRAKMVKEVEAAAEQKVKFAQQRVAAMQDQLHVHEGTISTLREEIRNVRADSQRKEMELTQWQNNTQELQQSYEFARAEQSQEVDLLQSKLRDLEAIHQAKLSEVRQQLQRASADTVELRLQLQRAESKVHDVTAEKDELARREVQGAEALQGEMRKVEQHFAAMREDLEARLKHAQQDNSQLRAENRRLESRAEDAAADAARTRAALEREEEIVGTLRRECRANLEEVDKARAEAADGDRKVRSLQQQLHKVEDSLRLSSRTANDTIEDLRRQLDRATVDATQQSSTLQREVARLRQELGSSEAIRTEVEDQLQRALQNDNAREVARLSEEKHRLQEEVRALENANELIREQVQQFTNEMQNDPVLKNARAAAQRVVELESQLRNANAELRAAQERVQHQDRELRALESERQQLQRDTQRLYQNERADVAELRRQLREKQSALDSLALTREVDGLVAPGAAAAHRLTQQRLEQLEERVLELTGERDRLESERLTLQDHIRQLERINNAQHSELLRSTRAHEVLVAASRTADADLDAGGPKRAAIGGADSDAGNHGTRNHAVQGESPAQQRSAATARDRAIGVLEGERVASSRLLSEIETLVRRTVHQRSPLDGFGDGVEHHEHHQKQDQYERQASVPVQRRDDRCTTCKSTSFPSCTRPASAAGRGRVGRENFRIGGRGAGQSGAASTQRRRPSPEDRFNAWNTGDGVGAR